MQVSCRNAGVLSACRHVQLKGPMDELRLLAWSNVISPFSSHVSGREGILLEETVQMRALALGRNETVKERATTWRA